ncbi:MAG: porin [Saprospiraceae bacterium]
MKKLAVFIILFIQFSLLGAQEGPKDPIDTLTVAFNKLQSDLSLLKKIKISGYIQAQYQIADSAGIASFAGGNFPATVDNRFDVRRGRIKVAYESRLTQSVLQIDVTQRGVAIKDAFMKLTEPYKNALSLTAGMFSRPISFECEYSSSLRETPERTRMVQTLLPGERELGAKLSFQAPKTSKWNILKIEAGLFNGSGPSAANDFDKYKDFIGNIGINKTSKNEKVNYAFRLSYYNGGVKQGNKFVYSEIENSPSGIKSWVVDSTSSNLNGKAKREYMGLDYQLNLDGPMGITAFRGEFLMGDQVGTASSSTSPNSGTAPTGDTYIRPFNGAYLMLAQNILQSKHQLVVKFDFYDPNTKVKSDEIGKAGSKLTAADIKYTTIGLGWNYRMTSNVKFMAYYDLVTNEKSANLAGFTKDLKDNVLTLRLQYKF